MLKQCLAFLQILHPWTNLLTNIQTIKVHIFKICHKWTILPCHTVLGIYTEEDLCVYTNSKQSTQR